MTANVSVIVPVYNGERFLAAALDSALAQAPCPLEVIVADDGSTDASAEIALSRAGVRCLRLDHAGVSAARNRAISEAKGEWLAFLDADDIWLPGKLATQLKASSEMPDVAIFVGASQILVEPPRPAWYDGPGDGATVPSYAPSVWFVRRDAFAVAGLFDTSKTIGEDTEWLARAMGAGLRLHMCPEVLVQRRIHDANASGAPYDRKSLTLGILRDSVRRKRLLHGGEK